CGVCWFLGVVVVETRAQGCFHWGGLFWGFGGGGDIGGPGLAFPVERAIFWVIGLILESTLYARLYHRNHLHQVLASFGLILIFEELRSIFFGDDVHGVPVPKILSYSIPLTSTLSYPVYRLFISGTCLAVAGAMYLVIQRTKIGMIIRAGSTNREMVQSLGINIKLVYRLVLAVGVTLAAFAGMIAAPISSVYPGMGSQILIICFVVV